MKLSQANKGSVTSGGKHFEIAEELNKLDVAVLLWEQWSEFLPQALVDSSQEEEYVLEIVRLEKEMAVDWRAAYRGGSLSCQSVKRLRGRSLSRRVLRYPQFVKLIGFRRVLMANQRGRMMMMCVGT